MTGLVITGGRVVDPASRMDAIGDVAVVDGKISAVGSGLGSSERVIDATGLVVAPGFIDLHARGQSIPADRMQAFDGVTTTLDLEAGVLPVASWYKRQADKGRVLNYGAAANWAFARIGAMTGSNAESSLEAFGNAMRDRRWIDNVASDTEVAGILDRLASGLNEGGIGIGILNAYAPGAGVQELTAVCQLAKAHDVATFTHVAYMSRIDPESAAEAYIRLIACPGATGPHIHTCHFNSSRKMIRRPPRSEERRVGKECRSRWSPYHSTTEIYTLSLHDALPIYTARHGAAARCTARRSGGAPPRSPTAGCACRPGRCTRCSSARRTRVWWWRASRTP